MTKALTQRSVEAAKPKAERYGRPDGLVPGLQLIVQPSGAKTYRLIPRVNGKQINLTIGNAAVLKLAEARDEARRQLALIAKGEDPRAIRQEAVRDASETVEVVARRFVERHVKVHTRGWYETERQIEREILPAWGKRPISSIGKRDVAALIDGIADRAPVMANRTFSTARRMFGWAIDRGLIEVSPFERLKKPAPETKRDRVLADSELALIWRAAEEIGYPFGPVVQILTLTAARRSEVAGMRWSELDSDLSLWSLPRERVKNGLQHTVPLPPLARSIIAALPRIEASEFVFTTTGKVPVGNFSRTKHTLDAAIADLCGPIPPWTLHDLRRSAASGMARLGVQLPVVEKILNHVSGSFAGVAGIYQRHDFADEKRAALECWARHLATLDLVGGVPETSRNPVSHTLT